MIRISERNPENKAKRKALVPKKTPTQVLADYFFNDPHPETLFFSFTILPKIGINPKSGYETPNGIYFYPLSILADLYPYHDRESKTLGETTPIGDAVPWAGDGNFIYLVRVKPETNYITNIQMLSYAESTDYISQIRDWFIETESNNPSTSNEWGDEEFTASQDFKTAYANANKYVFGKGWENLGPLVWALSQQISNLYGRRYGAHPPSVWNKIWRKVLGVQGVVDLGAGVIHTAEPKQAVFFEKSAFDVIQTLENTDASTRKTPVADGWNIIKTLEGHIRKVYYRNGKRDGATLVYDTNKKLVNRQTWKQDRLVSTIRYDHNGIPIEEERGNVTTLFYTAGGISSITVREENSHSAKAVYNYSPQGELTYTKIKTPYNHKEGEEDVYVVARYQNGTLSSVDVFHPWDRQEKNSLAMKIWEDGQYKYVLNDQDKDESMQVVLDSAPENAKDVVIKRD